MAGIKNNMKKFNTIKNAKNNSGFTLVEMLVSVTIFILTITAISTLFVYAIRAQRMNLAYQELLSETSYAMEYMSRAIRMAKKDEDGSCITVAINLNYYLDGQCLIFENYKGECQKFCLEGIRLKEEKNGVSAYLTSPNLEVLSFNVNLSGESSSDDQQPLVEIFLEIEGRENSRIQIQTSISQRDLDI